jgi:hypothetical protein
LQVNDLADDRCTLDSLRLRLLRGVRQCEYFFLLKIIATTQPIVRELLNDVCRVECGVRLNLRITLVVFVLQAALTTL